MHKRRVHSALLLLATFSFSACTAFFVPNEDDDEVQRCNNSEDCAAIDDNRFISQCVYGEGQPENSEKVCVADFKEVNCGAENYPANDPFFEAFDDVDRTLYVNCTMENLGKRGCKPPMSGCVDGLVVNDETGLCDDPDADIPAINPGDFERDEIAGRDIKDQFCRFYFCDESFVCVPSGSKQLCKPCDPDETYGEGGCGTIYIQGEMAPGYTANLDGANCDGTKSTGDVVFGQ